MLLAEILYLDLFVSTILALSLSIVVNSTGEIWLSGLDVVRTDRSLVFYESETNQAKLWDILAVYTWTDHDIGYVQGDLL